MSLAETAVLAVELKLNGASQFKAGISEADAAAAGLGKSVASTGNFMGTTASKMSLLKTAATSTGQAISGMASHFKNVITGPLGLIGLGAGLFTVAGAIKEGIGEAQSFGLEVQKLQALTGQSVESVSAMASALDHFGISGDAAIRTVGMLTKNIGNIVNSKAGVAGFATQFGLSLTDAKGHLVNINEEILRTADYFNNKSIPATEKAAGLAKLYGRSWQTLIPFLQAGRKGIQEAEVAAQELGLTLTKQNLTDLRQYRENFLTLGDAVKGLQLQVGLVLIPTLADLAKGVTNFLRNGGREKVVGFFRDAVAAAKEFGSFVGDTVIPTLSGLASAASGFWNAIPAPLRDIIAKGFIADRTIHFLFGVSPLHLAGSLLGDVAGPIIKTLLGNRLVPQPVIIVGGGVPGLPGGSGLPGAGGGGGLLAAAGGIGLFGALGLGALAGVISKEAADLANQQFGDKGIKTNFVGPGSTGDNPILAALPFGVGGAIQDIAEFLRVSKVTPGTPALTSATASISAVHDAETSAMVHQLTFSAKELKEAAREEKANAAALHVAAVATSKVGGRILSAAASRDKETSQAIKTAIQNAAKAVQTRATNVLNTAARHDAETTSSVQSLIRNQKPPTVNVSVTVGGVKLSTALLHRTVVVHRYGPTGGDRNSSARQFDTSG